MVRGIYTAASGALAAQAQADVIANSLANVNTSGFKRTLLQVASAKTIDVYRVQTDPAGIPGDASAGTSTRAFVGSLGTGALVMDTPAVFEQGAIEQTGNALDLAIQGDGFFAIQTPQGIRYTRDGSFVRDAAGYLSTQDGDRVLGQGGPIQLPPGAVQIGADGTISGHGTPVDTLRIAQFRNLTALRPEGANRFIDTGTAQPAPATSATIEQGALERSNSDVVRSMVDLITAQRWFEANQKVIQTQDTANGWAIENVGHAPQT